MKVVFIGNDIGAVYNFRLPLVIELISLGHDVMLLCNNLSPSDFLFFDNMGVKAINYPMDRSSRNPFALLKSIFYVSKILNVENPDVVFSYFTKPVIVGTVAAVFSKVKNRIALIEGLGITFTPSVNGFSFKNFILMLFQSLILRLSLSFANHVIVLNADDERFFRNKLKLKRAVNIKGIGVDLAAFQFREYTSDISNFVFVGRLLKDKGIEYFLSAAEVIKSKHPDVNFYVVGSPDYGNKRSITKDVLDYYIDSGVIEYVGYVGNVKDYIYDSCALILPSYYREGVPRSSQEALALGRIVITTNLPGCAETVIEGETGFFVEPNSVESLVDVIEYIISNKHIISEMSPKCRKYAEENFDINVKNKFLLSLMFM